MAHRVLTLSVTPHALFSSAALLLTACVSDSDGAGMLDTGATAGTAGAGGLPAATDGSDPGSPTTGASATSPSSGTTTAPGDPNPEPEAPLGTSTDPNPPSGMGGMPDGPLGMGGMPDSPFGMGGMPDDPFGMGGAPDDPFGMGGMDDQGMGGMLVGMGGEGMGMGGSAMAGMGGMAIGGMPGAGGDDLNSGENTMGWIGCSMGENVAIGYRRIGGTRMWGGYGNGGAVVQNWTSNTSTSWQRFDGQVEQFGRPVAVWIMICIFAQAGATIQEVQSLVDNARSHAAEGATIYITGQPLYWQGHTCSLAGADGPESTDRLAQDMAEIDPTVIYPGQLRLSEGEVAGDTCHANSTGEDALGRQAKALWGQP